MISFSLMGDGSLRSLFAFGGCLWFNMILSTWSDDINELTSLLTLTSADLICRHYPRLHRAPEFQFRPRHEIRDVTVPYRACQCVPHSGRARALTRPRSPRGFLGAPTGPGKTRYRFYTPGGLAGPAPNFRTRRKRIESSSKVWDIDLQQLITRQIIYTTLTPPQNASEAAP